MKRIAIIAAVALCLCGCGKTRTVGTNEASKRYFDAWVHVQKQKQPELLWQETALGSWLLMDSKGTGPQVGEFPDSMYLRVNYTVCDLEGNVTITTSRTKAQQLGTYDEKTYYGPVIWYAKGIYAGLEDVIKDMRPGGRRTVLVPGWLSTYNHFDDPSGYLTQSADDIGSNAIYDIELVEAFQFMEQWSVDSVARYLVKEYPEKYAGDVSKAAADSSGAHGFYYIQTKPAADGWTWSEETALKDTTVYINYIGRLLNGQVFDTNIRDTAIRYGFDRDKTYEPVAINYGSSWSEITMTSESTSVIKGFARTLSKMGPYEKGSGIFIYSLGYGYSGSGTSIPGYAALRFDVELVDNPN